MKLIKFEQTNCTPCKNTTQYLAEKGIEYESINVEHDPERASEYGIMGVPVTILLNDEGAVVHQVIGFQPAEIDKLIERL